MSGNERTNEFLWAAITGNEEKARGLLATYTDVSASSIHAAAAAGEHDVVRQLLEHDAALATTAGGPANGEPLLYLCFSCFLKNEQHHDRFSRTAKLLLAHGGNANAYFVHRNGSEEHKLSALYGAAGIAGNAAVAQALLEAGADPNDGESLYHAAELPSHRCLELLYQYGADLNGTPALLRKLDFDDYDGVKWFMERGADPNQTFGTLGPALHWAVYRGRSASTVELLIKSGAEVNARNSNGKTGYMLAVRYGQTELAETLLANGAAADVGGVDALFGAYATADEAAVRELLHHDPSLRQSLTHADQWMLLEFAELNKAAAVNLMLETGFDRSVSKHTGNALHIAGWFGHIETVHVLIRHGVSLTLKNAFGGTPLGSTIHGSIHCPTKKAGAHAAVAEAMLQAGAAAPEQAEGAEGVMAVLGKYGASGA